jgi:5,10-methylenetetrahydromethanopterin reductase
MPAMRFGIVAGPIGESRNVVEIARAAEESGFELLGLGDNQSLWRDVYVSLTLAALETSRIRIGPSVTNVITRDIAVTAGAIATVDELSGGRAFLGLGPGDSAVFNVGARPARIAEVESAANAIRKMLSGQEVTHAGRSMHVGWASRSIPICIPAEGPKGLAMAGRAADAAFVSFGLTPAYVRSAAEQITAGATAAGRDPQAVEVWHAARVTLAGTETEAMLRARAGMASVAHHALRLAPEEKGVPAELIAPLAELNAKYRPADHARPGDSFNARLVEELGLMPYLSERYGLVGTPEQVAGRLSDLRQAGVERLLLMFAGPDVAAQVHRWRRDVLDRAVLAG